MNINKHFNKTKTVDKALLLLRSQC